MAQMIALVGGTTQRGANTPLEFTDCYRTAGSGAGTIQWRLSIDKPVHAIKPGGTLQEWTLDSTKPALRHGLTTYDLNIIHHGWAIFGLPSDTQVYAIEQENWEAFAAGTDAALLCVADATWDLVPRIIHIVLGALISLLSGTSPTINLFRNNRNLNTLTNGSTAFEGNYATEVTQPIEVTPFDGTTTVDYMPGLGFAKALTANRLARNSSGITAAIDDEGRLWSFSKSDLSGTNANITATLNLAGMLSLCDTTIATAVHCDGTTWWVLMTQSNAEVEWGTWVLKSTDLATWTITQTIQDGIGAVDGILYTADAGHIQLNYDVGTMTNTGDLVSLVVGSGDPDYAHFSDGTVVAVQGTISGPFSGSFDIYVNKTGTRLTVGSGDLLVYSCTLSMPTTWGEVNTSGVVNIATLDSGTPTGQPCAVGATISVPTDITDSGLGGMNIDLGHSPFFVQTDGFTTLTLPFLTSYWAGWLYAYHHNEPTSGDTHLLCGPGFSASVANATASQSFTAVNNSQVGWDLSFGVSPTFDYTTNNAVVMDQIAAIGIGNDGTILYGSFTPGGPVNGYGEDGSPGTFAIDWTYATDAGDQFTLSTDDSLTLSAALAMAGNQTAAIYIPGAFGGAPAGHLPPVIGVSRNSYWNPYPTMFPDAVPAILWPDGTVDTTQTWAGACVDASGNKYGVEDTSGTLYKNGASLATDVIDAGDMVALLQVSRQRSGSLICIHGQSASMRITYITLDGGTVTDGDPFSFPTNEYFFANNTTNGSLVDGAFTVAAEQ